MLYNVTIAKPTNCQLYDHSMSKEDATSRWTAQPADEEHNQLTNDTRVDGVTESFIH